MKIKWPIVLLASLSLLISIVAYPSLPATIATHWGVDGKVNGYSPKSVQVFLGALPLLIYAMMLITPRIDPRKANYVLHDKAYTMFQVLIVLFLTLLNVATIAFNLGYPVDISSLSTICMGILFIGIGNYMGQFRHNYFVGIKTPWTLANEEVWRRTHRLGAFTFSIAGVMIMFSFLLPNSVSFMVTMGGVIVASLIPVVYSYVIFQKITSK